MKIFATKTPCFNPTAKTIDIAKYPALPARNSFLLTSGCFFKAYLVNITAHTIDEGSINTNINGILPSNPPTNPAEKPPEIFAKSAVVNTRDALAIFIL